MAKETIGKTISVAMGVCVVCSVFVSTAAVVLRPYQIANREADKQKNILIAATRTPKSLSGVLQKGGPEEGTSIKELFDKYVQQKWIDVSTGEYVEDPTQLPKGYDDEKKAAKKPDLSVELDKKQDIAKIRRRANYRMVYKTKPAAPDQRIILPVHGKGLWSTMYGFLALDAKDLKTVKSLAFYQDGETPGLGGEINNEIWQKKWLDGKTAFDDSWEVKIDVCKGTAPEGDPHQVDGLSGATLTANGVENLLLFWLGEDGYGPFLEQRREELKAGGKDG